MLLDYYLEPDNIHRLHEALCNLYCGTIARSIRELRPDGFWTSDDLSLFFSTQNRAPEAAFFVWPEVFRQFIKPYQARIGAVLERHGVHWWLHSCGNNTDIMGDLAEVGLDVFHRREVLEGSTNTTPTKGFYQRRSFA